MPDLEERFRSLARTPAPDLWREAVGRNPRPEAATPRSTRFAAAVVALVVGIAGTGAAVLVFDRVEPSNPTATADPSGVLAFVSASDGEYRISSIGTDGSALTSITTTAEAPVFDPTWSPDGNALAYGVVPGSGEPTQIWVADPDGANARLLVADRGAREPSWSPDGSTIAYTRGEGEIWTVAADGTDPRAFSRCGDACLEYSPAWAPDGGSIAFVRADDTTTPPTFEIVIQPVTGAEATVIDVPNAEALDHLAWSPDGGEIAFDRWVDGRRGDVSLVDADGSDLRWISLPTRGESAQPTWSPDGRRIAIVAFRPQTQTNTLYVMNADGGDLAEIPGIPGEAWAPSWRPNLVTSASVSPSTEGVVSLAELPQIGLVVSDADGSTLFDIDGVVLEDLPSFHLAGDPGAPGVWLESDGRHYVLDPAAGALVEVSERDARDAMYDEGAAPNLPPPAGSVGGHWRYQLFPSFGSASLAQWSGECEAPTAYWIDADGTERIVTGETDLGDAPASSALGWTPDGDAVVLLPQGPCGGSAGTTGVYRYAAPGDGRLLVGTGADATAEMWDVP